MNGTSTSKFAIFSLEVVNVEFEGVIGRVWTCHLVASSWQAECPVSCHEGACNTHPQVHQMGTNLYHAHFCEREARLVHT